MVRRCRPLRMDSMDSFRTANQELPSEGGSADLDDFQDAPSTLRQPMPAPQGPLGTWQVHARAVQAALFDQVWCLGHPQAGCTQGKNARRRLSCTSHPLIRGQTCLAQPSLGGMFRKSAAKTRMLDLGRDCSKLKLPRQLRPYHTWHPGPWEAE